MAEIAVVGAGVMGHGIAQVAAMAGDSVNLVDISDEILRNALEKIEWSLGKLAQKGIISQDQINSILKRIHPTTDLDRAVKHIDFMIEAVPESIKLKQSIFSQVDEIAPENAILASNTSGLSITMLAESTSRPEKVVGMHWMNPPQLMKLIEVVKGRDTSPQTLDSTIQLCRRYGKDVVIAHKDVWAFLVARSHRGFTMENLLMYLRGEATPQELDALARYKLGLPMGPFELADLTGLPDIWKEASKSIDLILERYPEFEPNPVILRLHKFLSRELLIPRSEQGRSGIKTGEGFYKYPGPGKYSRPHIPRELAEKLDPVQVIAPAVNMAAWCITHGIGSMQDIDLSFKLGYGWPKGIFEWGDELGIDRILECLDWKRENVPSDQKDFYNPDKLLMELHERGRGFRS